MKEFKKGDPHGYKSARRIPNLKPDMTRVQTDDAFKYSFTATPTGARYVAEVDLEAMERQLMAEADQTPNKPPKPQSALWSYWLGDGMGNLNSHEMRLLRQSLRLQPRDISTAMLAVGRDCPPGIVSRWEQNSQYGPPADVCAFLWACDRAVEAVAVQVLELAVTLQRIPDRHGGKAVSQFEHLGLESYNLTAEACQSLQVTAWDRAILQLRARGLSLKFCEADG